MSPIPAISAANMTDATPDTFIHNHGRAAPRVIDKMVQHAIHKGQYDEALKLDRLRRRVLHKLAV